MSEASAIERAYRLCCHATQRKRLGRLYVAGRHVWHWALARRPSAYRKGRMNFNWGAFLREFTQLRRAIGWGSVGEFE